MKIRSIAMILVLGAALSTGWAQEPNGPAAPAYVERDFSVGDGDLSLPGTLAMPTGDGPFPAVVLVHGSGPVCGRRGRSCRVSVNDAWP